MFAGIDPDTAFGFEFRAFPDIIRDFTVISTHDFKCIERNKCVMDGPKKIMTFLNKTVVYYDAATQLNLIKQPFAAPFHFRFLAEDPENIGSWIGIAPNSTFLNYLYAEDVASNYRIIVRLEWDNTLTYKMGVFEGDKIDLPTSFSAVQTINNGGLITKKPVTFCLNNRLDMATQGLSMIGIPVANSSLINSLNQNWAGQANPDQSNYNITWSLSDVTGFSIGNLTLNYTDMNANGTYRVKYFTPEFDNNRKCDVYTGSLFLRKYDFKYYYIEFNNGYDVVFSMKDFVAPPIPETPLTWTKVLKIILIVLVVLLVALIVYKNVCHTGPGIHIFNVNPLAPTNQQPIDIPLLPADHQYQQQTNPQLVQSYPQTLNMGGSYPQNLLSTPPQGFGQPASFGHEPRKFN
jgi:hypothetical protein